MSTILHVDSRWRDRSDSGNQNPAEFNIPNEVVKQWPVQNRTVQPVRPHDKAQLSNMSQSVKLFHLVIPYDIGGTIASGVIDLIPTLYVQLQNGQENKDPRLVNTLESAIVNTTPNLLGVPVRTSLKQAIFVMHYDKVQGGSGGPRWIHYKSQMTQTYRLDTTQSLRFRIFTPSGETLPIVDNAPPLAINPARQVNALFELTPYAREGEYDHHFGTLYDDKA